jgi:hypothetical protein
MKKSELRKLVLEVMGGYEPDGKGNLVRHSDKFDSTKLSNILMKVAKGPVNEDDEDKFYSKEEVIDYIKNHPPVKYYRIGVGQGVSRDLRDDAEAAIELVQKSGVNKYKLSRYGQVIQFTLPFEERHADLVRSMGSLD